ncbi:hypothetical protein RR48_11409 [Papilio machaon]|uniref:Uncharacterized protein n=1 Tax=Papilio machaon TaxID=76193 RepID=A0A194QPK8_PAPMA|nr:protein CEBPZOS [Papilio machaon]KPJ06910.1 hypothetical protein RR48_11409 [Papilio machaon]
MLTKKPKPAYKRFLSYTLGTVFVAETIGIAISYGLYFKLNTDRDFRLYMHKNYNFILEGYYGLGEYIGGHKTRELDQKVWSSEGKI